VSSGAAINTVVSAETNSRFLRGLHIAVAAINGNLSWFEFGCTT
jgi:hypothetical protein